MAEKETERQLHSHFCRDCGDDVFHYTATAKCAEPGPTLCHKCVARRFHPHGKPDTDAFTQS